MNNPITPENATETIAKLMLADVQPLIVDIEKSEGNRLYDAKGKRFYLDCFSYFASNPLGHNHPKMFEAEFEKKLLRVARTKPASSDFHTVEMAEFVDAFSRYALSPEFNHLFLVEGGAVAVENALKAAFDWKVRLNQKKASSAKGSKGEVGSKVIHFKQAFHGRCGYTLALTNTADPRKTKYFPKFDWPRITNPKITFPLEGENLNTVIALEQQAEAEMLEVLNREAEDVAAIIIETIQGEGGDNHFRPEFHRKLRSFADRYDVMLIYDEIQCGAGLTGKMWAYQHYDLKPDMLTFGKKLQVCGMMVGPRIESVENHVFKEASRINSTWGGNLVDMVRAQRYLEVIDQDSLVENAKDCGDYLLQCLCNMQKKYPQILSNARGLGLMCAIDVASAELRDKTQKNVFKHGAIILKCGVQSLRFRPALTFSKKEVDELIGILEEAVRDL